MASKGRVKYFDQYEGYGYIVREDGDDVVYVESAAVKDFEPLQEGDHVEFEVDESKSDPEAMSVTKSAPPEE